MTSEMKTTSTVRNDLKDQKEIEDTGLSKMLKNIDKKKVSKTSIMKKLKRKS
jgi:hypothetical protein